MYWRASKTVRPCGPCILAGTECTFAGLSSVCHACHKSVTRHCVGGLPDRQILLMPFKDPHPEDDQDILDIIDELIDTDPYGASKFLSSAFSGLRSLIPCVLQKFQASLAMILILNRLSTMWRPMLGRTSNSFAPHGPKSIASLVNTKEAYYQQLESNTHDLYLNLKLCHILVQHYRLVTVKLDETRTQEEAEASTAAKMRAGNHATSSSRKTYVPWWRNKHHRSGRGHGKKNQSKNKGKKEDRKGKGKNEATQYIKECAGWGCDHNNCDSNMETPDPVPALCTCHGWGSCGEANCPSKGSWTPPPQASVEYQDGVPGNYGGNWQSKAGSSRHGCY